jgi:hypothetical protein
MSKPQNPDTLVIQNQFYPNGLNEGQIYNYYQKNKQKLLREVIGKNLTFYFATELNKIVVMRKAKTPTGFLRLNYENYDEIITGRTISIHSNFNRDSDFGIIDIDIDDFKLAKKAVLEVYDLIETKCPFVNNVKIKYTGKESFHLLCYTRRIMDVDTFRLRMKKFLLESELNRNYTIEKKRIKGVVNLDLSSNKYLGGFITLGSLSVIGLQCIELKKEDVMKFRKEKAKI